MFAKLQSDVLSGLRTVKVGAERWEERERLEEAVLRNEVQVQIERNETGEEREVVVSGGRVGGVWVRWQAGGDP